MMKRIFQNTTQTHEEQAKKPASQKSEQLNISNIQRAIEDPTGENLSPETMMALQQTHGNQFAAQLTSGTKYPVQAKLTVTPAGDMYEREADATAQQVVADINAPVQREEMPEEEIMLKRDSLQRIAEEEEEMMLKRDTVQREAMDEEEPLQAKQTGDLMGGMDVSGEVEAQIEQSRGAGQALPDGVRSNMESGFGADFGNVRIHSDSNADSLSRSVQAQAFTTGSDIFFKQGAYDPGSKSGQELLAHELTHTIQQGASPKIEDTNGQ
jgi:hypothetical protein